MPRMPPLSATGSYAASLNLATWATVGLPLAVLFLAAATFELWRLYWDLRDRLEQERAGRPPDP